MNKCRHCNGQGKRVIHGVDWGCMNCGSTGKAKGYRDDIYSAMADAVEHYEGQNNPALLALVYSAFDMVEADDMSASALGHVKTALLFARSDLANRMDVKDGDYGIPEPDAAMVLHGQVDDALMGFPEIKVPA